MTSQAISEDFAKVSDFVFTEQKNFTIALSEFKVVDS